MSETANTLIKAALRVIGAIASGETPIASEMADGLQAMQMMFRHWSTKNIMIPYISSEDITTDGSVSYTWGTGGDITTARPEDIIGAYVSDDRIISVVDQAMYRRKRISVLAGETAYLWYSPEYPLGVLYIWPLGSDTITVDTLKALTDPTALTDSVAFPPGYDEAIKYNLGVRLASEYGRPLTPEVGGLALSSLSAIENRNFATQRASVASELRRLSYGSRYNIDYDG